MAATAAPLIRTQVRGSCLSAPQELERFSKEREAVFGQSLFLEVFNKCCELDVPLKYESLCWLLSIEQ